MCCTTLLHSKSGLIIDGFILQDESFENESPAASINGSSVEVPEVIVVEKEEDEDATSKTKF